MNQQKLYSYVRKALTDYHMIQENDKIAIGVSGGKDSIALLHALNGIRKFYPVPFEIIVIVIDLGFDGFALPQTEQYCKDENIPYYVISTKIKDIIFEHRKEQNPCALCSKLRKGALTEYALSEGCTKIAYGHHMDDVVETTLMSLYYEGRFHCFSPVTKFEEELCLIRPLIYVPEAKIKSYIYSNHVPTAKSLCPADTTTKRAYIKEHLHILQKDVPKIKQQIFHALQKSHIDGW